MAKELETNQSVEMSRAELHKGSGVAVSHRDTNTPKNCQWYIAECKPTRERTIRTMLQNDGYDVYLACRVEEKVYKSRNRYKREIPVLSGKIFVHITETQLMDILLRYPSVHRFMINRLASDREQCKRVYAYITEEQRQSLEKILTNAPRPVTITTDKLELGQEIEITQGPLKGIKGFLSQKDKSSYIVLKMEMGTSHYIFTEINIQDIQPL